MSGDESFSFEHRNMIDVLLQYGIRNERILAAMKRVKRHHFIPERFAGSDNPYGNHPCHIGHGQTISQPYIVAYMSELLNPGPEDKILEIGAGSGYQTAILAELGATVYSIEVVPELADHAKTVLAGKDYENAFVIHGDGYNGHEKEAPYDFIIGTCAPESVPERLVDQLKIGGKMIIPVGSFFQSIEIISKGESGIVRKRDIGVRFVPMVHAD